MANNTGKCIYEYECECVSPCINNIICRLGPKTKVIDRAEGCTADDCRYCAYLLGRNEENSPFYYEIALAVESCVVWLYV
jgi:xanthine dehydrogenase iron-sulfur cluster and FAD-binding subunit A